MANLNNTGNLPRCSWCGDDPVYRRYHDEEWGVPVYDDKTLFEFLILEGAQAGLSWITILKRRDGYRQLFADFDASKVARFTPAKIEAILQDKSIIRNRRKVESAVTNAKAFLRIQDEFGSFSAYSWRFIGDKPKINSYRQWQEIPATTEESIAFSKDLRKRGFKFVGPTIMYAHMQAVGMVNDHVTTCFRYQELLPAAIT